MKWPDTGYGSVEKFILARAAGRRILHIGCAGDYLDHGPEGVLHHQLSLVAKSLDGVEIQPKALATLRTLVPEDAGGRIRYHLADAENLAFLEGKSFDLILAASIIEHLSNPGRMLRHFRSLCSPGGEIIIVTPNPFGLLQFLRVALRRNEPANPEHTSYFSPAVLTELCRRFDLEPTGWHTVYGWRPPSRAWRIKHAVGIPVLKLFPHVGGSLIGVFRPAAPSGQRPAWAPEISEQASRAPWKSQ